MAVAAGDIAFVGVVSAGGGDNATNPSYFAFVVRTPITNGSIISFTDALAGVNLNTGGNGANDGVLQFTANTTIAAGSVVIINTEGFTANISNGNGTLGASVGTVTQPWGNFNLQSSSATVDQIYAYNGAMATSTTPTAGSIIAGIDFSTGTAQTGAAGSIIVNLGGIGAGGTSSQGSFITVNPATALPATLANAASFSAVATGTTASLLTTLESIDTVPPTAVATVTAISADTGTAGDFITSTASQIVSGTYTGTLGTGETIQISTNGTTWVTATAVPASHTWSVAGITLPAGTGSIQVRTIDTALNAAAGTAHAYTLDTAPPTFAGVDVVTVAGNDIVDAVGEQSPLTVAGNVVGADGGTATVEILDGSNAVIATATNVAIAGGAFSTTFTGQLFASGGYSVRVTATDVAGNTAAPHTETFSSSVCFLAGTMIRTPAGETAVDKLAIGDMIMTADGKAKPVKFIGRQTISMIFADKLKSQPILIKAGALGENLPARDLYTSPGHSMLVDGVLAIAGALVNGSSIVRWENTPKVFTYYHIELEGHEIVFAEGAATESYCDNVPHDVFDNGRDYKRLYPNAKPIVQMDLPTVKSQRQLPAATRKRLAERAVAIGAKVSQVA